MRLPKHLRTLLPDDTEADPKELDDFQRSPFEEAGMIAGADFTAHPILGLIPTAQGRPKLDAFHPPASSDPEALKVGLIATHGQAWWDATFPPKPDYSQRKRTPRKRP